MKNNNIEEMLKNSGMPRSISVIVQYDKELEKITGTKEGTVMMSEGSTLMYLLQNIFIAQPDIEEKYPPGTLGFSINGIPPTTNSLLMDGDTVAFSVFDKTI